MNKPLSVPIDQNIHEVLQCESFNNFTVTQLRDAYILKLKTEITLIEARKVIYRQILRLQRLGLIKQEKAKNPRDSQYSKTPKFFKSVFKTRVLDRTSKSKNTTQQNDNYNLSLIEEQLKQYNVDFLASVAESEEYKRLYKTNPELKTLLETEYHQAREQSSKLLGQIKALNTVINHLSN